MKDILLSRSVRGLLPVLACAFLAAVTSAIGQGAPVRIALSGTPSPTGVNYGTNFGLAPVLSNTGRVAFFNSLSNGNNGMFTGTPGALQTVAVAGTAAPGGGNYSTLNNGPLLSSAGQVAIGVTLTGGTATTGTFAGTAGALQTVALQGTAAPAGGNFVSVSGLPLLNASGQVAIGVSLTGGTAPSGVFAGTAGALQAVALQGTAAPAGGNFANFTLTSLNNSGRVAFLASLTGGTATSGVFAGTAGALQAVALQGSAAPAGGIFSSFGAMIGLNDAGQVAFNSALTGGTATSGLFAGVPGSLQTVALQGATAPAGGNFSAVTSNSVFINRVGAILFRASLSGGTATSGIFAGTAGSLQAVALQGGVAPGAGGGTYSTLNTSNINEVGQVAFVAALTGTGVTTANNLGLYRWTSGTAVKIVQKGDQVDVDPGVGVDLRTVSNIAMVTGSAGEDGRVRTFNDSGALLYVLTFTDTSVGLFATDLISLSNNADLSALALTTATLNEPFAANTTSYTANVPNTTSSVTVTPTSADANATIQARVGANAFATVTSGSPSAALPLAVGANTIEVKVTAQDGTTIKTYTITVTRAPAPTVTSVSPSVAGIGSAVTITGTGFTGATTVTIGGVAVASFTVVNDTTITTTVPSGISGLVNVVVTTAGGPGTGTGVLSVVDYLVTTTSTSITCTDAKGGSDTLTVTNAAFPSSIGIRFTATGRTFSVDGGAATTGDSGSVNRGGRTSITINAGAGNDTIDIGGFGGMPSLTINGGTGDDTVNFSNNVGFTAAAVVDVNLQDDDPTPGTDSITFAANATLTATSGTGNFTFKCSRNIQLDPGSSIEIGSGTLTLEANQQTTPSTGDFAGIFIDGARLTTNSSGGSIVLKGRGGDAGAAAATPNAGIYLLGASEVTSGGFSANGLVTMVGTSGAGGDHAAGVFIEDSSIAAYDALTPGKGDVTITGTAVGTATGSYQRGIDIQGSSGSYINAYGTGRVTLIGTGAPASSGAVGVQGNDGIFIETASAIYSEDGDINISGTGGQGTVATLGQDWQGIQLYGDVNSTGFGNIALTGTAGISSTDNHGIVISSANHSTGTSVVTAAGGTITLTGSTTSAGGFGLLLDSNGSSGTDITLIADTMWLRDTNSTGEPVLKTSGAGIATLKPLTAGKQIAIGAADSSTTLGLTDNELDLLDAGALTIGSSTAGTIVQVGDLSRISGIPINFVTNGGITIFTGTVSTPGGNVTYTTGSGFFPGAGSTTDVDMIAPTVGTFSMAGFRQLAINVQGAGNSAVLRVKGKVDISGSSLQVFDGSGGTYIPSAADSFTIVDNDGTDPVIGTFTGLTEGATVSVNGVNKTLTYVGGDGNDVVLTGSSGLTITNVSPATGGMLGSTSINITGTGFTGASIVTIGGINVPTFTVVNDTTITLATPAATSSGLKNVVVVASGGTATGTNAFGYADYVVSTTGGTLDVLDTNTAPAALSITQPTAGNLTFSAAGRLFTIDGGALLTGSTGSMPLAGKSLITVSVNGALTVDGATVNTGGVGAFLYAKAGFTVNAALNMAGSVLQVYSDVDNNGVGTFTVTSGTGSINAGPINAVVADADIQGSISSLNTITLLSSNTRPIDVGTNTLGSLGLTDAELDRITTPRLEIGDNGSGPITVSAVISPLGYTTLALGQNTTFAATGGFQSEVFTASSYEKIAVVGAVTINPSATFAVTNPTGYIWNGTDSFTFLDNDDTDAISGSFSGPTLTNFLGSTFTATKLTTGGTGNDFVILAPAEIAVDGFGGNSVVDGSTSPSLVNGTDFGSTSVASGSITRTFTIKNLGGLNLNLTGAPKVVVTGPGAADYTVTVQPTTPVLATTGTTTFEIVFDPSVGGLRTATVSIANDDSDENPFDFAIQGTGSAPEIAVEGNATNIVDGDTTPSATDHTNFGITAVNGGTVVRTFTIKNTGNNALNLTGTPKVAVSGANAGDFTVTTQPTTPLAATTGTTTFQVTFDPSATGLRTATLTIANDDSDENPFDFAIQGTGLLIYTAYLNGAQEAPANVSSASGTATVTIDPLAHTMRVQASFTGLTGNSTAAHIHGPTAVPFTGTAGVATTTPSFVGFPLGVTSGTMDQTYDLTLASSYNAAFITGNGGTTASAEVALLASMSAGTAYYNIHSSAFGGGEIRGFLGAAQPPSVTSISPSSGFTTGGITVTLTGSGFTGVTAVTVGGLAAAAVNIISDTSLSCVVPASGTAGAKPVVLAKGNAAGGIGFTYIAVAPEMAVSGNATNIVDGDATPSLTDHTDFGTANVNSGTVVRTFTISNSGTGALTLSGTPKVAVSGTNFADFTVTTQPTSPLAATNGTTTFQVTFDPSATGVRTATLTIANDDSDENPFDFSIQGTGVLPPAIPGLVGYYTFEGNTNDVSGAGNHPTSGAVASYSTGVQGQAAFFDGISNTLILPLDISPTLMTGVTMGGWVKCTNPGARSAILSADDNSPANYDRQIGIDSRTIGGGDTGSNSYSAFAGGTTAVLRSGQSIDSAQFTFVVARYDGTTVTLFVGNQVFTANDTTDDDAVEHPQLWMGKNPNFDAFFQGYMDNMFVFNRALTDTEVGNIRAAGAVATAPTVTTPTSASINSTIATLGGNVTGDGGDAVTERGVVYAKTTDNANPLIAGLNVTKVSTTGTTGVFTVNVTGLLPNTGYSFKAYATNGAGTSYTSVTTFTTLRPEIAVEGNATNLVDGDTTPSASDHTDFGSTAVTGGTVVRTFTIRNTGTGALTLNGTPKVAVSGTNAAEFTVTLDPSSLVAATNGTTTFQVTFDPSASGLRAATLSIANDDSDENPFDFAIQGTGAVIQPVNTGALGDVTTSAFSPNATGANDTTKFNVLGRGGYLAANGTLGFPGTLMLGGTVTNLNNQGYWKDSGTGLKRLVRSSDVMLGAGGATLDALPTIPVPGLNSVGQVTLLGTLRIGTGTVPVTASDDTAMWSEAGGSGLHLLARENDPVTVVSGAFIDSFGFGCYATATTGVGTGEAAFTIKMKGATTQTALIRRSITGPGAGTNVIIAREGSAAPGVAGQNFGAMNSALTNAVRMDSAGNLVFEAQTKPNNKFGIWYQPIGGSVAKVFTAGDTAPGTSSATFGSFDLPSMGSSGTFAFHAVLNKDGDNVTNAKNSGIWRGTGTGPFTAILRRGDAALPGMVVGSKVGNLWNGWLNLANHGAWKGWVDTAGDGISAYPADTFGIYTDIGGTMRLLISAGDTSPGIAGATIATIDHPVVSGNTVGSEYVAFLGTVTGGGVIAGTNDKAVWRSANGAAPTVVLRTGDTMTTSQGTKTVFDIDIPGSKMDVRPWEQSVMDDTGRILIIVTFDDGSTSQVIAQ